ncbi:MAG: dTDP-4-dehydrorhamnose reductase [Treponema sp.]|nr:dTDP-4-dehydrorhamnose reductase [Treponema sp.]
MIWLIGNKGMLGTELSLLLEKNNINYIGTDREVDITDIKALGEFSEKHSIEWIINCAAYTAVDRAQDERELCRLLNTEGPCNIAALANEINAKLIHISTDYVFNGKGSKPYTEEDTTDPIGIYGLTKRDGEEKLLKENEKSFVIRTAWLYGKHGNNFVYTMLKLMKERESISVVNDQKGSPTWAKDLARTIIDLINKEKIVPYGIYHYTNEGEITWFDFAKEIYTQANSLGILDNICNIKPCTSAEFPAKVSRPSYSVLDKTKIKKTLGLSVPVWNESLIEFLKDIKQCKEQ